MSGRGGYDPASAPALEAATAGGDAREDPLTAPATGRRTSAEPGGQAAWHALDTAAVLQRLESGPAGPADTEHARRLAVHGPNLPEGECRREPWWEELGESVTEQAAVAAHGHRRELPRRRPAPPR